MLIALGGVAAQAQLSTTASITGTVTDSSGAVVPDASVDAVNQNTMTDTPTKSNGSGVFVFPSLTVGTYTVKVSKQGFKEFVETNILLHPATVQDVNVTLSPGAISSQISVTAGAVAVETSTSEISNQVEGEQVGLLPLNGRNYQALAAVMPGVINSSAGNSLGTGGRSTSAVLNVNGLGNSRTFYALDGVWNENTGNMSQNTVVPNPDTLEEVRVLQNNYSARYSLMGSSVVLLQTKSGGQSFHGQAFEYLRNDKLNARNFFAPAVSSATNLARPPYKQNIFGYDLSGPFFIPHFYNTDKHKTFFFWSEQLARLHTPASPYGTGVTAAPAELSAPNVVPFVPSSKNPYVNVPGFPNCAYPMTPPPSGFVGPPTEMLATLEPAGGVGALACSAGPVPAALPAINANSLALLNALYPSANFGLTNSATNFINEKPQITNQRDDEIKVEQMIKSRFRLMVEFLDEYQTFQQSSLAGATGGEVSPLNWETDLTRNKMAQVSLTQTWTPSMVNTTSAAFNIFDLYLNVEGLDYVNQIPGFSETLPFNGFLANRIPSFSISGSGWSLMPQGIAPARPLFHAGDLDDTISDDWSWLHGRNYIQADFNVVLNGKRQNQALAPGTNGTWAFNGTYSGNALADFLFGDAASFAQVSNQIRAAMHGKIISPYLEDRFQLTRKLTLTAGLRVWHMPWPYTTANTESLLIPADYVAANAPVLSTSGAVVSCPATCPPNYTNGLVINGANGTPINFVNLHNWYYGPMVGFAWDVFGDGKTSLRGGYGITYTKVFTNQDCSFNCTVNPPFVQSTTLTGTGGATPSYLTFPTPGSSGTVKPANGVETLSIADPNAKATSVQSYSLSLQHQFQQNWLVTIAGAGSQGRNLQVTVWNYNTPPPTTLNGASYEFDPRINTLGYSVNFFAPFQGYGAITTIATRTQSSWSALEATLRHPVSQNLFFTLAFTWSHDLTNQAGNSVVNIYNPDEDYGNAEGLNFPWDLTWTLVWNLPWFRNDAGFKGHVLGGWQLSNITTLRSGSSFSPGLTGSNLGPNGRPNATGVSPYPGQQVITQWLNPSAFAAPAAGFYGNAPIGMLSGPGLQNFDTALYKDFHITERTFFQFRAEAFNVLNHTNFNNPNATFGSSTFGVISSAKDPRILEFALRFEF